MALKDIVEPDVAEDDIDRIVDALLEDPANAGDIKTLLRNKITSPDVVSVARATRPLPVADDLDEFWDNVPV